MRITAQLARIVRSTGMGFAGAALLSSCVTVQSAPAGDYAVGTAYRVTLGRQWSDVSNIMPGRPANVRLLTVDGPLLNRLYLTDGLAPGDFLVRPVIKEKPTPTYRAGLSRTEEVEFIADSVAALDYERVETENLRPATFEGAPALRFDIVAKTKNGLDMSGSAEVSEIGGKLFVMLYLAPTEHFYSATLPEIETVFSSVKKPA